MVKLISTITCPDCKATRQEEMPTDACQWFYECIACGAVLKPIARRLLRLLLVRYNSLPANPARR